jgi:magnesium chelatase subunit I
VNFRQIVQWFELGGALKLDEAMPSAEVLRQLSQIQDLLQSTGKLGLAVSESDAMRAAAGEFILEGLYSHRRISRNEELAFIAGDRSSREERFREERDEAAKRGFDPRRGGGNAGGGRRNLN